MHAPSAANRTPVCGVLKGLQKHARAVAASLLSLYVGLHSTTRGGNNDVFVCVLVMIENIHCLVGDGTTSPPASLAVHAGHPTTNYSFFLQHLLYQTDLDQVVLFIKRLDTTPARNLLSGCVQFSSTRFLTLSKLSTQSLASGWYSIRDEQNDPLVTSILRNTSKTTLYETCTTQHSITRVALVGDA